MDDTLGKSANQQLCMVQTLGVHGDQRPANKAQQPQRPVTTRGLSVHQPSLEQIAPASSDKTEQGYSDSRRKVSFANGTVKYVLPDGLTEVHFVNGDVMKQQPNGTIEYYYREVDTWHSTLASGIEVCFIANMIPESSTEPC